MRAGDRLKRIIERLEGPSVLLCGTSVSFMHEEVRRSIQELERDRKTDFDIMEASPSEGNIGIDSVRELTEFLASPPVYATRRYGIVIDADRLTSQASNAFLKILEEHRPDSVVILLSQRCDELLETVKSRCLRLHFSYPVSRVQAIISKYKEFKAFKALMMEDYEILCFLERMGESSASVETFLQACRRYGKLGEEELVTAVTELLEKDSPEGRLLFHCWFREFLNRVGNATASTDAELILKLSKVRKGELLNRIVLESLHTLREFVLVFGSSAWHLTRSPDMLKQAALLHCDLELGTIVEQLRWFLAVASRKVENLNSEAAVFVALLRLKRLLRGEKNC